MSLQKKIEAYYDDFGKLHLPQIDDRNLTSTKSDDKDSANTKDRIEYLANLSSYEYGLIRRQEAKALGLNVSFLDKSIREAKIDKDDDSGFTDIEPWETAINLASLLDEISNTVLRFIVCEKEVADAAALWAAMTWVIDVIQVAPLAVITAPEKRCGKSQLLTLLKKLSCKPLSASNISPAALFRCIESWQPTLLLDETDTFLRENEELRGIVNSGHTRDTAYVIRTVGDDHTPKRFSTWAAKALAGIGHLSDTLMDRAVILELRRKLSHESVERLRYAEPDLFETLARKLARFAADYRESIRLARPDLPEQLNDRAQDNWEPLLAIAGVAGQQWPDRARAAALKLSAIDDSSSVGNQLLADIREVFESKSLIKISTSNLAKALIENEENNWATYNRGKPLTPKQLVNKLNGYAIKSKPIRIGYEVVRGFELSQFEESFLRYLTPEKSVTTLQTKPDKDLDVTNQNAVTVTNIQSVTNDCNASNSCNVTRNENVTPKPAPVLNCNNVTLAPLPAGEDKVRI